MCVNRFAPITFKKLWELELWMVLIATGIFIIFVHANKTVMDPKRYKKLRKMLNFHEKKIKDGKVIVYSKFISVGYMVMLVLRIFMEFYFLQLEYNLAVHQSGKTGFQAFMLPEEWKCNTNMDNNIEITGESRRDVSDIFFIGERNTACGKSRLEIDCWIPASRMKQKGLIFMYAVLMMQTFISFIELFVLLWQVCCRRRKIPEEALKHQQSSVNPNPGPDTNQHIINVGNYATQYSADTLGNLESTRNADKQPLFVNSPDGGHAIYPAHTTYPMTDAQRHITMAEAKANEANGGPPIL